MRAITTLVLTIALFACGGDAKKEPVTSAEPPESTAATPEPTSSEPAPAPAPKKRKPYEIVNLCPRPATIIFGEDPKAPNAGSKTLAGNDKIDDGPRDADGNEIIHLVVRGEPLVKVRVSRGTKRVEIGTSCDTLEMH